MKRCCQCGVPIEGLIAKLAEKLFGVKPSEKNPESCNKCEPKTEEKPVEEKPVIEEGPVEEGQK